MTLKTIQTGSEGNCHILTAADGKVVILDCGIHFNRILKHVAFGLATIEAVCVTHSHKDHSLAVSNFKRLGVNVIDSKGTYRCGDFRIKTFDLVHDVPCIGFAVTHPEMGMLIYLTDTEYCKYRFKGVNHILVECNYDKVLLDKDHPARQHIFQGHMEIETTREFVRANKKDLRNVILCHMSRTNLDFNKAITEIKSVVGDNVNVQFCSDKEQELIR